MLSKLTELNSTKASAAGSKANLRTQIVRGPSPSHSAPSLGLTGSSSARQDDLERQVRSDLHDSQSLESLASQADVDACAVRAAEQKDLIAKAEKALEDGRFENQKREGRAEIGRLEAERETLAAELKEVQAGMERRAKLGITKTNLAEKRKMVESMSVSPCSLSHAARSSVGSSG